MPGSLTGQPRLRKPVWTHCGADGGSSPPGTAGWQATPSRHDRADHRDRNGKGELSVGGVRMGVESEKRRDFRVGKSRNTSSLPGCQKRWWADSDQNLPVIGRRMDADTSDGTPQALPRNRPPLRRGPASPRHPPGFPRQAVADGPGPGGLSLATTPRSHVLDETPSAGGRYSHARSFHSA